MPPSSPHRSRADEDEASPVNSIDASFMLDTVSRLGRAAFRSGNIRLRPWGLTLSSYAAMRVMADRPHLSLAQLSRRCFVRPQTMIRIVNDLQARELVERGEHEDSKRAMALALTPEGLTAVGEMALLVNEVDKTLGRVLDAEDVTHIDELLRRCAVLVERETERLAKQAEAARG